MTAVCVRQTCGCTRYLSPTRLALHQEFALGSRGSRRRWHCSSSSLPTRLRTESRSPPMPRNKFLQHQSRANSTERFTPNKVKQYVKYTKENVYNLKSNMKDWMRIKKVQLDVGTLSNVVGALNVEVPKSWPDYRKYLTNKLFRNKKDLGNNGLAKSMEDMPTESKKISENDREEFHTSGKDSDVDKKENITSTEECMMQGQILENTFDHAQHCSELVAKAKHGVLSPDGKEVFVREQHNFSEAMENTYYSTIDLKATRKQETVQQVDQKLTGKMTSQFKPASILQQISMVEPTNILNKQLATLKKILPGTSSSQPELSSGKTVRSKSVIVKKDVVPKASIDRRTRGLIVNLKKASTNMSRLVRLEELGRHLVAYPQAKTVAMKEKVLPILLRLRSSRDANVREQSLECLALVGWVDPVGSRGIRVLTLDGGGTRGLMAIQMLRKLEIEANKEVHELFDYICGVSTGSLLGIMLGVFHVPLDECEHLYRELSKEVFQRSRLMGTSKLFTSHAFYDSDLWQKILEEHIGCKTFLKSRRDHRVTMVSAVSSLVNQPIIENFIFRNYTYPPGSHSHYPGSTTYTFSDAIRASSAAPGYFEEKKLGENIHQDGGLLTNNPSAIAVHECKLLWPKSPIHCVVSIGTGRFRPSQEPAESYSLKDKLVKIVQSATDTEAVHTIMQDLLPPSAYFRFNPYMSEDFTLNETRQDKWEQMKHDTEMYCRKNEFKFHTAAQRLTLPRQMHQKVADYLKLKSEMFAVKS